MKYIMAIFALWVGISVGSKFLARGGVHESSLVGVAFSKMNRANIGSFAFKACRASELEWVKRLVR